MIYRILIFIMLVAGIASTAGMARADTLVCEQDCLSSFVESGPPFNDIDSTPVPWTIGVQDSAGTVEDFHLLFPAALGLTGDAGDPFGVFLARRLVLALGLELWTNEHQVIVASASDVPELGTLMLMATGLLLMGHHERRI